MSEDGGTRTYRSTVRAARAERTRAAVVVAARELFEANGFAATTITAIAERADVSVQTVYSSFGSKGGLVRAILEQMEESADATAWRERIERAETPHDILGAFAGWTGAFFAASRPALHLAQDAAAELGDLAAAGDEQRRRALNALIARLRGLDAVRTDLTDERAVDRAWLVTGLPPYLSLVVECGWSELEYVDWLAETLGQQVLRPRAGESDGERRRRQ